MRQSFSRTIFLVGLALVFTVGLTFASVELPYLVDGAIMTSLPTLGFDSQVDEVARLKTELFISHYNLRVIGYACFGALLLLIGAGFATKRSEFAALGALGFMLPVFAQFAGVMFFLAGLGLLNLLWLPVLDISFGLSGLGAVIRAPYDLLRWLFGVVGVNGYWPIVYLFIGSGLLIFFLGTLAWLSARSRKEAVAASWIYRLSRHPQYLGWILWSYGVFLLLLQARYPKRSWGISASLPWLISTVVIIGVAMLEEINMRRQHGREYEAYRKSAPFLFPVPRFIERAFALPFRILFRKERPERGWEVAAVLIFYTALLIAASSLLYGGGLSRLAVTFRSEDARREYFVQRVAEIRSEPNARQRYFMIQKLGSLGKPAVAPLLELLEDDNAGTRVDAAAALRDLGSPLAFDPLVRALEDPDENVRWRSAEALGVLGAPEAVDHLVPLLNDSASHIQLTALGILASLGAEEVLTVARELAWSPNSWVRSGAVDALGSLGSKEGLPTVITCLNDEDPYVRRHAVIALLRIGSPEGRPPLEEALGDEDREVRLYAAEALQRLPREPRG
jgi:protein-S-isoprenylcysteine O-methyltransferase Ste14